MFIPPDVVLWCIMIDSHPSPHWELGAKGPEVPKWSKCILVSAGDHDLTLLTGWAWVRTNKVTLVNMLKIVISIELECWVMLSQYTVIVCNFAANGCLVALIHSQIMSDCANWKETMVPWKQIPGAFVQGLSIVLHDLGTPGLNTVRSHTEAGCNVGTTPGTGPMVLGASSPQDDPKPPKSAQHEKPGGCVCVGWQNFRTITLTIIHI